MMFKSFGKPKFTIEVYCSEEDELLDRLGRTSTGMTRADLSHDQVDVYDRVIEWLDDDQRRQYLKIGGLAGTGKSTIISVLANEMQKRSTTVAFGAYTGKAANVLGRKLRAAGISASCGTLHSLMYDLVTHNHDEIHCENGFDCDKIGRIERWAKKLKLDAGLVVVDEASMLGEDIWNDLRSFGVPILAVGDHGQLPPVGHNAINLMENPDLKLEKIHRQAADNPIIQLAHYVRSGRHIRDFVPTDDRVQFGEEAADVLVNNAKTVRDLLDLGIIVGYNSSRVEMNSYVRESLGYEDGPGADDIVICLRNFKAPDGLGGAVFNGQRGVIESIEQLDEDRIKATVLFLDDGVRLRGELCLHQFGHPKTFDHPRDVPGGRYSWADTGLLFDYGFVLTCHKAQGSQFSKVIVKADEAFGDDPKRWIYTAATRASERLVVL